MINSMTGYGRGQSVQGPYDITVEMKAVNHRYFECFVRTPRAWNYLDDSLKKLVHQQVNRGKIEIYVSSTVAEDVAIQPRFNSALAQSYLEQIRLLGENLGLQDDVSLSRLISLPDVLQLNRPKEDEEFIWKMIESAATQALTQFSSMRRVEGEQLASDIAGRLDLLESYIEFVETRSPQTVEAYRERLHNNLMEILNSQSIEEQRILTEAAIFADKVAVAEETVRLRSHLEQFRSILEQPDAVGRKLDFLVQEMNREVNTIGSKSQDVELVRCVVDMKSEIEKIREQVQNIE